MTPVPIVSGLDSTKRTMGSYGYDRGTRRYQIQIRRDLLHNLDNPRRYWNATNVVLHEMIHQYLQQHVDWRMHGHGDEFTEWCNKIAPDLGLPRVFTRKPRGRTVPLARHWPNYVYPTTGTVAA